MANGDEDAEQVLVATLLFSVLYAVLHRQFARSPVALLRTWGPWLLASAVPVGCWLYLIATVQPGHRESFYGWAVVTLSPLAFGYLPFAVARVTMTYRAAVYYPLTLFLTYLAWFAQVCLVAGTMDS